MTILNYVLNKDYCFNLTNRTVKKRLSSEHGIVKCALELSYYLNRESSNNSDVIKYMSESGWNMNYSNTEILNIYQDVAENSYFIDKNKVNNNKHIVAVL